MAAILQRGTPGQCIKQFLTMPCGVMMHGVHPLDQIRLGRITILLDESSRSVAAHVANDIKCEPVRDS